MPILERMILKTAMKMKLIRKGKRRIERMRERREEKINNNECCVLQSEHSNENERQKRKQYRSIAAVCKLY